MDLVMSRHAERRAQQRGISRDEIEALVSWGRPVPVGGGASSYTLTRAMAAGLAAEGVPAAAIERLPLRVVVVAGDGRVVTVAVLRRSGRGQRRYRHGTW